MKGISALVATVLLLAFTIAVAGIVSIFFTSFAKTNSAAVNSQGQGLITCIDSTPTVSLVKYSLSGVGIMNVTYSNSGNDNLLSITIYTRMSNGNTYVNSSGSLPPLSANSTQLFNINGLGTPLEVRVVGLCSSSPVSGSCLTGQSCMVGV